MARTRIVEPTSKLASWDDVDMALAEIGELQRGIEAIEADMQKRIDDIKLAADIAADPNQKRIAELETQIKLYVEAHAEDMDGKKTKVLNFGSTGFRKSTKVILPRAAVKVAEIIRKLKGKGMTDCVVAPPEKIDKDALKKYPPNEIVDVGANLQVDEVIGMRLTESGWWKSSNHQTERSQV